MTTTEHEKKFHLIRIQAKYEHRIAAVWKHFTDHMIETGKPEAATTWAVITERELQEMYPGGDIAASARNHRCWLLVNPYTTTLCANTCCTSPNLSSFFAAYSHHYKNNSMLSIIALFLFSSLKSRALLNNKIH